MTVTNHLEQFVKHMLTSADFSLVRRAPPELQRGMSDILIMVKNILDGTAERTTAPVHIHNLAAFREEPHPSG